MPKELFRLTKNVSNIQFNVKGRFTKLRTTRLIYTTASADNYNLMMSLSGWETDHYYDGRNFTKIFTLPRNSGLPLDYVNTFDNLFDFTLETPREISNHVLTVYINNDPSITDISSGNPLYIEFEYE